MRRFMILAQSPSTADALNAFLDVLGHKIGEIDQAHRMFVLPNVRNGGDGGTSDYHRLVDGVENMIQAAAGPSSVDGLTVLVDSVRPEAMGAISEQGDWSHLIALLVLTFPEVLWIFGTFEGAADGFQRSQHSLETLMLKTPRNPLLDPTGLRNWVRDRTNEQLESLGLVLPTRSQKAAAIDEEKAYAYSHGYTAYRFGFRADTVFSWALMQELFGTPGHDYYVLLEDMSLNFPDRPLETSLLDLAQRADKCPGLNTDERSRYRVLITSGQDGNAGRTLAQNIRYLHYKTTGGIARTEPRALRSTAKVVYKPLGGMLDLWSRVGHTKMAPARHERAGNADGFCWPPAAAEGAQPSRGHGAPGKLMLVADALVRRAESTKAQARAVEDFIRGAVLAGDAAELLGGRTPTLALTALALKHEFETRAECEFIGTGYHFDVHGRTREIALEVRAFSEWVAARMRRASFLNAQVVILGRLSMVFRESGRSEEEDECLTALRRHHRHLQFVRSRNPVDWALNCVLWYAELLLGSFGRFSLAILLWLVGLTAAWSAVGRSNPNASGTAVVAGVWSAFFGGNAASEALGWGVVTWSCVAVVAGVFHLGVFISYIYTLVSRK